jgi:hypothetical protein
LRKFLSGTALDIVVSQIENHGRPAKGRRFGETVKVFALGLEAQSPKAYEYLSQIFMLPSQTTLHLLTAHIDVKPGLSQSLMKAMQKKVQHMSRMQKLVAVTFDEMSIKTFLSYQRSGDFIEGFVQCGEVGDSAKEYANQALVICVHGLFTKWKQPLGYVFSNSSASSEVIKNLVDQCLHNIKHIGLTPVVIICDQGATNRSMYRKLGISKTKPYFDHAGTNVYAMFDVPHLLKCVRNNLINQTFVLADGQRVEWEHFRLMVEEDTAKATSARLCPKVSLSTHVDVSSVQRMRVKFAAQTFSNTTASALMTYSADPSSKVPTEAGVTGKFFKQMDCLFDIFNSTAQSDSKPFKCALFEGSQSWDFLDKMSNLFAGMKVIKVDGKKITPPTFNGWQLSINAMKLLFEHLKSSYGIRYLRTRNFSQDCLENLFGVIRRVGGTRHNPTPSQFRQAFKHCAMNDLLSLRHSGGANCEMDAARVLLSFSSVGRNSDPDDEDQEIENDTEWSDISSVSVSEINNNPSNGRGTLAQDNILYYLSGVCLRKLKAKHKCACSEFISLPSGTSYSNEKQLFTYLKALSKFGDDFGALNLPTVWFDDLIFRLNEVFLSNFDSVVHKAGVVSNIYNRFQSVISIDSFGNDENCRRHLEETLKYFVRMRVFYSLNAINANIASADKCKESRKFKNLLHR